MSQNLQNVVKFQKFQLDNLVDFEKCCKTHIFLQKSEPIQRKTSNILPKFCQPTLADLLGGDRRRDLPALARPRADLRPPRPASNLSNTKFCKLFAGLFSAESKRNFARKYAFDSIFQALQDLHTVAPLQSQNFSKKSV